MKRIYPTSKKLLLKPITEDTIGKVILPNKIENKFIFEVVEIGDDCRYSVGDKLLIPPYKGHNIEIEKQEYTIIDEEFILGKIM
jgi:co-chaperonin GroES (HSP10)